MKRKSGFTLIELLAVIVILAIIALIAVPVILGIVNDTKFKKYKIEEGYIKDAAKLYYASKNIDDYETVDLQTLVNNKFVDPVVDMGNGGYCEGKAIEVSDGILKGCLKCSNYTTKGCGYDDNDEILIVDYNLPNLENKCVVKNSKYYDNNGKVTDEESYNKVCKKEPCGKKDGKYYNDIEEEVTKEDFIFSCKINADPDPCSKRLGKYYDETGKETTESQYNKMCNTTEDPKPSPDNDVLDSNPGVICGNGSTNNYEGFLECHIKSVEDLVTFTKLVNIDGYDFTNHTVYLDKDLNITETNGRSYVNQTSNAIFDINGNETISSIKEEMTTGKGFLPIGSEEHPFKGTFEGQANTIKNLMINRPDMDNVGLFGYVDASGKVSGFNLENISIVGNDNTGAVAGQSLGLIREIVIRGDVLGHDNVGGVAGLQSTTAGIMSILSNTNITGNSNVYGISIGGMGVVESGTITGNSNVFKSSSAPAFVNENVKLGNESVTSSGYDILYHDGEFGNLNIYDSTSSASPYILDTYLGGDNDTSGYYFDYDSNGKVVLKSTTRNPIDTTLKGSGTQESPYLIYTPNDMKKIAAMPPENNYYLLMNDIDFKGKKYYMIGNFYYPFVGTFEGGAHSIKNIELSGYQYAAPFGRVEGSIYGFNIVNVNVEGIYYNAAAVVGYGNGNGIKEITVSGKVKGLNNVGGVSSQVYCNSCILRNLDIEATASNSSISLNLSKSFMESGSITAKSFTPGLDYGVSSDVTLNVSDYSQNSIYGSDITSLELYTNYSGYDRIDTWLGGDSDGDGYYFDYDSNGKIVVRNTKKYPINPKFKTLKPEKNNDGGTQENPYLIYTANDMKKIAAIPTEQNYYLLMNDIDFKDKKYYTIGTPSKPFYGTFDGGAHTLKNIKIRGGYYTSLFYLDSTYEYPNVIYPKVFGLNIENIDAKGGSVVIFDGPAHVKDISITGNIQRCYGISNNCSRAQSVISTENSDSILVNANVSTTDDNGISVINNAGIFEAGSLTTNGRVAVNTSTALGEGVTLTANQIDTSFVPIIPANKYNNLEYYGNLKYDDNKKYMLETKYSGDVNGNGYWFDYNSDRSDIVVVKADKSQVVKPFEKKPNPDIVDEVITNPNASIPECNLIEYNVVGKGFNASYTCTDSEEITERRHIYWIKPDVDDYNLLIRWQAVSGTPKSIATKSVWTEVSAANQGIDLPYPNNCYYFYYGVKNKSGNSRMYRSKVCKNY